ncbi:hypothetical protein RGQ29_000929 [Quercus rubra]|uniref:DUF7731 domain-containing protein n=1 Tax=Quercus rubra TaxID=3512 RepID=A0AAN7G7L1_QUERU|nr:hypothetical protein RGQ29_000929 [Quercus rubra]
MAVLKCITDVKRDFWFATRAHVQYVSDTISKGCSARKAFTTVDYKASRGIKVYQKAYVSVISSLVVLVAIFNPPPLSLSLKGILAVYSDGVRNLC